MPSMERDLRQAIAAAMADNLDSQVINGSGAGANLSGLFHQADDVNDCRGERDVRDRHRAVRRGRGREARQRVLRRSGADRRGHFQTLRRPYSPTRNKGDLSAYDVLKSKLGGLRVSTRVPALDATGQKGICVLSAQGQPVTVPVWRGVELIIDPYSQAGKGQRVVTAVTLVGSPFIPYGVAQAIEIHPKLS